MIENFFKKLTPEGLILNEALNKLTQDELILLVDFIGTDEARRKLKKAEQINLAIKLVKMNLPREIVAGRLINAFQFGRSTAYRRISTACQYLQDFGTDNKDNIFISI